jgi:hypothetical protein
MKLTENVLKQTIREVISELLEEDKPKPARGPKEASEFLKTVTDAAKEADKSGKEQRKVASPARKKVKEDIDEVSGVPVAKDDDFDPLAASEALDKVAGVDDVKALDVGPVNEKLSDKQSKNMDKDDDGDIDAKDLKALRNRKSKKKGDVSEQEMPDPELPKVPDVKTEVPAAEKMTPPKAPAGQQTTTPMSLKEHASAKHNRIFESLVKSITKK